eukprot:714841-Rhodomonas_salina.1
MNPLPFPEPEATAAWAALLLSRSVTPTQSRASSGCGSLLRSSTLTCNPIQRDSGLTPSEDCNNNNKTTSTVSTVSTTRTTRAWPGLSRLPTARFLFGRPECHARAGRRSRRAGGTWV